MALDDTSPFELNERTGIALAIAVLVGAVASAAGVGGGALYIPLFSACVGFGLKSSTALSQACITAGAATALLSNLLRHHPHHPHLPLVDLALAAVLLPVLLVGVGAGVLFNVTLPSWLLTALLLLLLPLLVAQSVHKGLALWRQESKVLRLQAERTVQQQLDPHGYRTITSTTTYQGGDEADLQQPLLSPSSYGDGSLATPSTPGTPAAAAATTAPPTATAATAAEDSWQAQDYLGGALPVEYTAHFDDALLEYGTAWGAGGATPGSVGSAGSGTAAGLWGRVASFVRRSVTGGSPGGGGGAGRVGSSSLAGWVRSFSRRSSGPAPGVMPSAASTPSRPATASASAAGQGPRPSAAAAWRSAAAGVAAAAAAAAAAGAAPGPSPVPAAEGQPQQPPQQQPPQAPRAPRAADLGPHGPVGLRSTSMPAARAARAAAPGATHGSARPVQLLGRAASLAPPAAPPALAVAPSWRAFNELGCADELGGDGMQLAGPGMAGGGARSSSSSSGLWAGLLGLRGQGALAAGPAAPLSSPAGAGGVRRLSFDEHQRSRLQQLRQGQGAGGAEGGDAAGDVEAGQGWLARRSKWRKTLGAGSSPPGPQQPPAAEAGASPRAQQPPAAEAPAAGPVPCGAPAAPPPAAPTPGAVRAAELVADAAPPAAGGTEAAGAGPVLALVGVWGSYLALQIYRNGLVWCSDAWWWALGAQMAAMLLLCGAALAVTARSSHQQPGAPAASQQQQQRQQQRLMRQRAAAGAAGGGDAEGVGARTPLLQDRDAEEGVEAGAGGEAGAEGKGGAEGGGGGSGAAAPTHGPAVSATMLALLRSPLAVLGATLGAGLVGGLLGLGGGMVMGPVMLQLGEHPQVTAATSSAMILLSSSSALIQFALLGRLNLQYAAVFGGATALASLAGTQLIAGLVRASGRPSVVVLALAAVMAAGAACVALTEVRSALRDWAAGAVAFRGICDP